MMPNQPAGTLRAPQRRRPVCTQLGVVDRDRQAAPPGWCGKRGEAYCDRTQQHEGDPVNEPNAAVRGDLAYVVEQGRHEQIAVRHRLIAETSINAQEVRLISGTQGEKGVGLRRGEQIRWQG